MEKLLEETREYIELINAVGWLRNTAAHAKPGTREEYERVAAALQYRIDIQGAEIVALINGGA